jgi:hypothetical protein
MIYRPRNPSSAAHTTQSPNGDASEVGAQPQPEKQLRVEARGREAGSRDEEERPDILRLHPRPVQAAAGRLP